VRTHVLVIEDDRDERMALASWLALHGFHVTVAGDGREALVALTTMDTPPALIFLDLEMPEVDGWRVLASLALEPTLRAVPVIVTSGVLDGAARIECPTVAFAPKPLHPEALESLMVSLLMPGSSPIDVPLAALDDEPTSPHVAPGWARAETHPTDRMPALARLSTNEPA
jgi:CheY-like chemotaxis protein